MCRHADRPQWRLEIALTDPGNGNVYAASVHRCEDCLEQLAQDWEMEAVPAVRGAQERRRPAVDDAIERRRVARHGWTLSRRHAENWEAGRLKQVETMRRRKEEQGG